MHVDDADILRELIDAADETATSNPGASYARWSDDREIGQWAILPGAALHRDSETLQRSNAEVIRADIVSRFGDDALLVESASHWAVGWTEAAFVAVGHGPAFHPAAAAAVRWARALADYPVADESHFSELEYNEMCEYVADNARYWLADGEEISDDAPDDWPARAMSAAPDDSLVLNEVHRAEDIGPVAEREIIESAIALGYVIRETETDA